MPVIQQSPKYLIYHQQILNLPQPVTELISIGPKFAIEPKCSPPDLLAKSGKPPGVLPSKNKESCIYQMVSAS